MKVYWTKKLTYDKKELIDDFCEKHNIQMEWQKGTDGNKGYYKLIDLDEREETAQLIQSFYGEEKIKTTKRSNHTAAMSSIKNSLYYLSQEGLIFEEMIELVDEYIRDAEKKWHIKIDKSVVLTYIKKQQEKTNIYREKHIERGKQIFSGNGKALLVGAYKDITTRSKRLIQVAQFLEGIIDEDYLIYDHKGLFYFCTFNDEETNLLSAIKYFKRPLLQILGELHFDHDEIFSSNKDDFTKSLSMMRDNDGGGFIDLSNEDEIVMSFLRNI